MDWTLLLAAISAIGAATAAGAAAWQAYETRKQVVESQAQGDIAREQFLQARYDESRPILVIISDPKGIPVHNGSDWDLDWSASPPMITVYNTGNGPALNVRSVIYGPEALAVLDSMNSTWTYWVGPEAEEEREKRWHHWTVDLISQGKDKQLQYTLASKFTLKVFSQTKKYIESNDHKQKYAFNAPKQPLESASVSKEPWCICRVMLTYQDIFHRKHASIYDLVFRQGWQVVALIDYISNDIMSLKHV
jgi:hypothetical protein